MAVLTGTLIGAAAGLGGAAMSANAQKDAARRAASAAQYRPFSIYGQGTGLGNAMFNPLRNEVGASLDPRMSGIQDRLLGGILQRALPNAQTRAIDQSEFLAAKNLPALFDTSQRISGQADQLATAATQEFSSGLQGLLQSGNTLIGDVAGIGGSAGVADPLARFAQARAQGLLGQDFRGTVDNTLANLRASARTQEERAVNSRVQDLFNRGILSSTAGARSLGELALAQEQADIGRQLQAEQLGLQAYGQNLSAGQGLLNTATEGLLGGAMQNNRVAQTVGSLGMQNLSRQQNLLGQNLDANLNLSNLLNTRGAERLNRATGLLGFNQNYSIANQNNDLAALGGALNINTDLRNLIALGGNIGGTQAQAGANQAQALLSAGQSPAGGFLSGLGSGLLNASIPNLSFGSPATTPQPTGGPPQNGVFINGGLYA